MRNVFILFIFMILLGGCKKVNLRAVSSTQILPYQEYHWELPPLVAVCKEAPYSLEEVRGAVSWWEERGFEFLDVISLEDVFSGDYYCPEEALPGLIIVRNSGKYIELSKGEPYGHAYGSIRKGTDVIQGFILEIREPRRRVLEHEIGHALGWKHFNKRKHLMHYILPEGGWNDYGLSNNRTEG